MPTAPPPTPSSLLDASASPALTLVPQASPPVSTAEAEALVQVYEQRIADRDFAGAWDLLSAEQQAKEGSLREFAADKASLLEVQGPEFVILDTTTDRETVARWLADAQLGTADWQRSVLVSVDYPRITHNAGWAMLMVGPDENGVLKIWQLR